MKYKYKISAEIKLNILIKDETIEIQTFRLKPIKNREFYYELSFEMQKDSPEDPQLDAIRRIKKITEILSIVLKCKVEKSELKTIENTDTSEALCSNQTNGQFYIIDRAIKKVNTEDLEILKNLDKTNDEKILTAYSLFYEAKNIDNNITKFWLYYSILQLIIGKRGNIDQKYKTNNPNSIILYSDHEECERSIVIIIRDVFSHINSTYNGKRLNLIEQLNRSIDEIENFTRNIIIEEATISQRRQ